MVKLEHGKKYVSQLNFTKLGRFFACENKLWSLHKVGKKVSQLNFTMLISRFFACENRL